MKIKKLLISMSVICLSLFSQNNKQSFNLMLKDLLDHSVPEITSDSLKNHFKSYLLLDAREIEEFTVSHLQSAKYVGYDDFDIDSLKLIKKKYFYCCLLLCW